LTIDKIVISSVQTYLST